jgi:hypothetical protein
MQPFSPPYLLKREAKLFVANDDWKRQRMEQEAKAAAAARSRESDLKKAMLRERERHAAAVKTSEVAINDAVKGARKANKEKGAAVKQVRARVAVAVCHAIACSFPCVFIFRRPGTECDVISRSL